MTQTAVEWFWNEISEVLPFTVDSTTAIKMYDKLQQAKEMEAEQIGYTKEDVLKAGEIGEINHHDYKHIVKLLDEAREINREQLKQRQ